MEAALAEANARAYAAERELRLVTGDNWHVRFMGERDLLAAANARIAELEATCTTLRVNKAEKSPLGVIVIAHDWCHFTCVAARDAAPKGETNMTNLDNLTLSQINAMSAEAAQAGDLEMVADCAVVVDAYLASDESELSTAVRDCEDADILHATNRIVSAIQDAEGQE